MAQISKQDLYNLCKQIAPQFNLDPLLILAIAQQEAMKDEHNPTIFLGDVARLEEGFYNRYIRKMTYATTTEILLSTSFGCFQMMGQSLVETKFFFEEFDSMDAAYQIRYQNAMSEENVPKAINRYCEDFSAQVKSACKHFTTKLRLANGITSKALLFWNGGSDGAYPDKVLRHLQVFTLEVKKGILK